MLHTGTYKHDGGQNIRFTMPPQCFRNNLPWVPCMTKVLTLFIFELFWTEKPFTQKNVRWACNSKSKRSSGNICSKNFEHQGTAMCKKESLWKLMEAFPCFRQAKQLSNQLAIYWNRAERRGEGGSYRIGVLGVTLTVASPIPLPHSGASHVFHHRELFQWFRHSLNRKKVTDVIVF